MFILLWPLAHRRAQSEAAQVPADKAKAHWEPTNARHFIRPQKPATIPVDRTENEYTLSQTDVKLSV